MTLAERFNELYASFNNIIDLLTNIETYVGIKDETDTATLAGRIAAMEAIINNTRQIIEDRLSISGTDITLSFTPKDNSGIYIKIMEDINGDICEIAELEQSNLSIDGKILTLDLDEFDGKLAKVIYTTHEV